VHFIDIFSAIDKKMTKQFRVYFFATPCTL